jgi:ribulose 1,5-bisphosphate synthetase/thiazole synthase
MRQDSSGSASDTRLDVVVVGAGLAGLRAARALVERDAIALVAAR